MASQYIHTIPNNSRTWHSASDPLWFGPNDNLHVNQSLRTCAHHVTSWANHQCMVWGTNPHMYLHSKYKSLCTYALHHPFFWKIGQDVHTQRLMAIPSPWIVTNLTMYGTPPTCAVTFGIGKGVESAKLGPLAKFHAQLVSLAAW